MGTQLISWCNASVILQPSSSGIRAQITTAKHCINPWTFRDVTMELAGQTGYIEAKLKSDYLDKIAALSTASSGKIESIAAEGEIDFSQHSLQRLQLKLTWNR